MKKLKKLVAAMLCLVTVLCTTATAFAAEAPMASDPAIAEVTIFSTTGDNTIGPINISGHSFIHVKNISTETITVGGLSLGPDIEITFGTFGNIEQHKGMWYNIEAQSAQTGGVDGRVSLTTEITKSGLTKLNNAISANDKWSYLAPCSTAAVNIWNAISDTKLSAGTPSTPTALRKSIMSKPGYETDRAIKYATPIGYVNNSGKFIEVLYTDLKWKDPGSSSSNVGEIL